MDCIKLGNIAIEKAHNKDLVLLLGNTGVGKSTMLNYVCGKKLILKENKYVELDRKFMGENTDDGEFALIGHGNQSVTFTPGIFELKIDEETLFLCDCPGFTDSRGAEINIANSVNISTMMKQAKSVRFVLLFSHSDLTEKRGKNIKELSNWLNKLTFTQDTVDFNREEFEDSILLAVTQIPLHIEQED